MVYIVYILVFLLGAIAGSFLNVVVLRHNTGMSLFWGSSRCFSCGKKLLWHELLPILSFLVQKGRCLKCHSKISWQYPIVEFITGTLFVLGFLKIFNFQFLIFNQFSIIQFLNIAFLWVVFSLLIVILVYDLRHQIIPNGFVYLFDLLVIGYWLLVIGVDEIGYPLSGLCFSGFFALLWLVSRGRWIGFGDAKLALGLGWLLGPAGVFSALLLSFWIGSAVSIFLLIFKGNKFTIKSRIAFAPFLIAGSLISFLFSINLFNLFYAA